MKHVQVERCDATPDPSSLRGPSRLQQMLSNPVVDTGQLWAQRPWDATTRHIEAKTYYCENGL